MEPNVILKYKRPTDSWVCPSCDCENKIDSTSCSVCASDRPTYPVLVNAWCESDDQPAVAVKKQSASTSRKSPAKSKSPVSESSYAPSYAPSYTPFSVIVPPKKKSGSKVAVVILTIILIAAIIATAVFIINKSGDFIPDAVDENEVTYQDAMDEFDDGNYEKAIELFGSLPSDYNDTAEMIKESKYQHALTLMKENDAEKINEAKMIFEELNGYEDSDYQRKECIYKLGEISLENEEFEEAKELFESISGHEDADDKAKLCEYKYAIELYTSGEYEKAEGLFRNLGDYEDSEEYLIDCAYSRADKYLENDDFIEAMKIVYESTSGNLNDTKFGMIQNSLRSYNYSYNYFPGSNSLIGNWKNGSGDTLSYYSNESGGVTCQSSMPYTSADKFYVEYGFHYHSTGNYSNEIQWAIQRVSSNSIKVFNYRNGQVYNFSK